MSKTMTERLKSLVLQIEQILNTEIPGTGQIGARQTMYVPLPGTGSKARHILSPRAQQVFSYLMQHKDGVSSADLMKDLRVNRNVIAGAVHELKAKGVMRSERRFLGPIETAAEYAPRPRPRATASRKRAAGSRKRMAKATGNKKR